MRNLIYGINLTIDGCCDHTKGRADEYIHIYFAQLMTEVDTLLYGRTTYELMVPFWPDMARNNSAPTKELADFAHAFDSVKQIVVCSRTLPPVNDGKTTIIRDNLADEVRRLKQQEGKPISTGGVNVPSQLVALGLVDELRIVVQPVIAGEGRRLFDTMKLVEQMQFKLVETTPFPSGSVALRYTKNG